MQQMLRKQKHSEKSESETCSLPVPLVDIIREPSPLSKIDVSSSNHQLDPCSALLQFRDDATACRIQSRLKENEFMMEADDSEHAHGSTPPRSKNTLDLVVMTSIKTSLLIEEAKALSVSADISIPYCCVELLKATLSPPAA